MVLSFLHPAAQPVECFSRRSASAGVLLITLLYSISISRASRTGDERYSHMRCGIDLNYFLAIYFRML